MGQKEFILVGHSRGVRVHHGREVWQQVVGMTTGAGI